MLRRFAATITVLLLGAMVLEICFMIKGPVYLWNEFLPLSSMPQIAGKYVNISELPNGIESSVRKKLVLENSTEYFYCFGSA